MPETVNIHETDGGSVTVGLPEPLRNFIELTRCALIATRVKHGADTPIGHRCSNIVEMLEADSTRAGALSHVEEGIASIGKAWSEARPNCRDVDSCIRHQECMYHGCPHGRASGYTCGLCGGPLPCLTHNQ